MLIRRDVAKLAFPILVEQLFITTIGVLNTIIASGIGKEAISAIGTVDSFNNIIIFFLNSMAVGSTVVVAQYMGQKNKQKAKEAGMQAIFSGVLISCLITFAIIAFKNNILLSFIGKAEKQVVEYAVVYFGITLLNYPLTAISFVASGILRSSGYQSKTMKINITITVTNIVLSYLLIYGVSMENQHVNIVIPGMGVKGAAIAITTARLVGVVLFLFALLKNYEGISWKEIKSFRINLEMQKTILNIGLPAGIESFIFNIGKFVQQIIIISLGTASIAANTISWSVFGLLTIPGNAFSIVAMTMVGYSMGMEEYDEAGKINIYLVKLAMVSKVAISLIVFPLASIIASAYSADAEVIMLTSQIIRINAVSIPLLWPVAFIVPSGLKGAGDTRFTMVVSVISMWTFRVLVGYILSILLGMGVVGMWVAMCFDWIARGIIYYIRLLRGKWIKKMVA